MSWILVGRLGRPHGVRGELRLWPLNRETELLSPGREIQVGTGRTPSQTLTLSAVRHDSKGPVVRLDEITDRNGAEALTGLKWFERRDAFPEPEADEIYVVDLIGMQVLTEGGEAVGRLSDVWQHGAHDTYVVKSGPREHLIPAVDEFVVRVDTEARQIIIRPVEGLLSED
ncbi:MAG: ribosome maturation factor RimM [Bradymonadia bacterium]